MPLFFKKSSNNGFDWSWSAWWRTWWRTYGEMTVKQWWNECGPGEFPLFFLFFGEKGKKVNIRSYGGSAKWSTIPVNWLVKVQKRLSILHKFVSGQESSKGVLFEDTNVWVMIFKKRLVRAFNPIYQKVLSVAIGSNIFVRACALDNLFKYIGGIIQKERPLGTLRQGCNCSTFLSAHWAHFGGINPGTHHWRTHQRRFQHGNFVCVCSGKHIQSRSKSVNPFMGLHVLVQSHWIQENGNSHKVLQAHPRNSWLPLIDWKECLTWTKQELNSRCVPGFSPISRTNALQFAVWRIVTLLVGWQFQ